MPPDYTIAFTQSVWDELAAALDEPRESAGVLLAGVADTDDRVVFVVSSVRWIPDEHYLERESDRLTIASAGWMPALKQAARRGLHPLFFHTHPGVSPTPSPLDDQVDAALASSFMTRAGVARYASVILGGSPDDATFYGRARTIEAPGLEPIGRARVIGSRIRLLRAHGHADRAAINIHERQVMAFGPAGQALLAGLRVGVVGAGGTGSAVIEQLIRIGVGAIVAIDDDTITPTNISRVYGSSATDVNRPKVEVAQANADRIGLGTELVAIVGRVTDRQPLEALRTCDVIFGCTDDHTGRLNLSKLAFYYLIPVIDVGVAIDGADGAIRSITGRVTFIAPGEPCLLCRGTIDPARIREEGLPEHERVALAREGYARGLADPDPSVIAYTTMVAAWGIADLLERLIGFGAPNVPGELRLRIADRKLTGRSASPSPGHFCGDAARSGQGDQPAFLGQQVWLS